MIHWPTVFFQIMNFLIIVWILKRYLFGPVVSAMDRREREIRDRLKSAEKLNKDSAEERRALESELLALEGKRAEILAAAREKADAEGAALVRSFNKGMQERREEELAVLERERAELKKSVMGVATRAVVETAGAALSGLANSNVERALVDSFAARADKRNIADVPALKRYYKKAGLMLVNASFGLDAPARRKIRAALSKLVGGPVRIRFGLDEKIVCGLEVVCDSMVVSFGLGEYIERLGRDLDDGLAAATRTPAHRKRKG
jgi:F-type H+-transporting ATPase subunit b